MSKYVDGEVASIEEIDEKYNDSIKRAEEVAKQKTQELRDEIAFYKRTDFKEIEEKVREEIKEIPDDEIEDRELFFINNKKEMAHMSNEEKEAFYQEAVKNARSYVLSDRLRRERSKDILFDLMTDEQVEEYAKLTYVYELKSELVAIKEEELFSKAKIGTKERLVTKSLSEIESEIGHRVFGVVDEVEELDEEKREKRENIKEHIKNTLALTGMGLGVGALGGAWVSSLSEMPYGSAIPAGAAMLGAAALAVSGVLTYRDFTRSKKAIEKSKELGLYELIEDQYKAQKEKWEYVEGLAEEYDVSKKVQEAEKGRSL